MLGRGALAEIITIPQGAAGGGPALARRRRGSKPPRNASGPPSIAMSIACYLLTIMPWQPVKGGAPLACLQGDNKPGVEASHATPVRAALAVKCASPPNKRRAIASITTEWEGMAPAACDSRGKGQTERAPCIEIRSPGLRLHWHWTVCLRNSVGHTTHTSPVLQNDDNNPSLHLVTR